MGDVPIKDVWSSLVESHFDVSHRGGSSAGTRTRLSSLDSELLSMNRAMIVAKQRRNMLTGACHVPPEVLSTVFALVQKGWRPHIRRGLNAIPGYNYGWMNITHVCSYWREVAVQTASLWTGNINHVDIPPGLIPSICDRVRDLPIQFYLGLHWHDPNVQRKDLAQLMPIWITSISFSSRVQSLTLYCHGNVLGTVYNYLSHPMRSLSKLSVEIESSINDVHCLPSDFCPDARLSELRLWGCLLPWNSHLLSPSLSSLELIVAYGYDIDIDLTPTYEEFHGLMSLMTSLQSLWLENIFPNFMNTPIETRIPINLSHTNHIYIEANQSYDSAMLLVPLMAFSSSTCVEIRLLNIGEDDRDMPPEQRVFELLPLLGPVVTALYTGGGVTAAEIVVGLLDLSFHKTELPRDGWTINFPRTTPGIPDRQIPPYGKGSAFLAVESFPEDRADPEGKLHLCRRFLLLPLRGISAISFTRDAIADLVHAGLLFGLSTMPAIRRLGIEIQDSAPFLSLLSNQRVPGGAYTVFPLLEIIHVHAGRDKDLQEAKCSTDTLALFNLVGNRRMSGTPLREIVIEPTLANWDVWTAVSLAVPVSVYDFYDYGAREFRRRRLSTS